MYVHKYISIYCICKSISIDICIYVYDCYTYTYTIFVNSLKKFFEQTKT